MATNTSLLSYGAKISSVEDVYYSPVVKVEGQQLASLYCFLGNVTGWPNGVPPVPTQDQYSLKQLQKNIFAAKLVSAANISPVVPRVDWTSGVTYDHYDDTVNMFQVDQNGFFIKNFYVKNKYDQIFKCLWNANDSPSTVEPVFQPGAYNTNNVFVGSDGYKWKYIYTISTGDKINFLDSTWMPISVGENTPSSIDSPVGVGSIDVINVTNGGSGYDAVNSAITITVTGDGTGCTANVANVYNGVIRDISVITPGQNYSYANVTITTANTQIGSGAVAIALPSPVGGHGWDPVSDLGCSRVMISVEFAGAETYNGVDMIPTDITYYQAGILINATSNSNHPAPANLSIYNTTTQAVVAAGFGNFVSGETAYQGNSLADSSFSGTVVSFNSTTNVISLINTKGTLTYNAPIFGQSSTTIRTLLNSSQPDFITQSGYVAYIENLTGIQRSSDGIEQFKFVLGY